MEENSQNFPAPASEAKDSAAAGMEENSQNLPARVTEGRGSAAASLVLGLFAIAGYIFPFLGLISSEWLTRILLILPFVDLIISIVGVALAHNAGQRGYQGGMRTAGSVLSIIALTISAILVVLFCALVIFAVHTVAKIGANVAANAGAFLSSFLSSFFSSLFSSL